MPKGIYDRTAVAAKSPAASNPILTVNSKAKIVETPAEASARIAERFEILEVLTDACLLGNTRSLIVSGPAGLGKSYTVEDKLKIWDSAEKNHTIIKGYIKATGLFKLLYDYRQAEQVIVFDDSDGLFFDQDCLNLLKAVCDTTERRRVSWQSEATFVSENDGEIIPKRFDFNGSIIFITNLDFDLLIGKGHKLAPHLQAMVSRSHYIDLSLKTRQDFLIRIGQVVKQGLLDNLKQQEMMDVVQFIEDNSEKLRELSLRMAIKIGHLRRAGGDWMKIARITCCRQ